MEMLTRDKIDPAVRIFAEGPRPARIVFFFFSSRRRHTRYIGDWSSDVCSSDLYQLGAGAKFVGGGFGLFWLYRSEERRVGKSVDLGGSCVVKRKKASSPASWESR